MESRRGALIDIDKDALEKRMRKYYDPEVNWEMLKAEGHRLTEDAARFNAKKTREKVLAIESFNPANLRRYSLRPLENRWCFFSEVRPLWNRRVPNSLLNAGLGMGFLLPA